MSYCVNCGVELDKTCGSCPLCNTPVYNPNQPVDTESVKPFPVQKGTAELAKRHESTILISTMLLTTSFVCFLLNQFLLTRTNWSIYVIGVCVMLWIFLLPVFFPSVINTCFSLILNGLSIAVYLRVVSFLHPGNGWYQNIGLPIASLATILLLIFYFFSLKRNRSFITKTVMLLCDTAILCIAVEILLALHYRNPVKISWSAVVLICSLSISVILMTIYFLKGIRNEIRRRLHF